MVNLLFAAPAYALGRLAWTSVKTGNEWTRYGQWDAVATNWAIGAVLGGMAAGFATKALPHRH
jgi:hypothetical protein